METIDSFSQGERPVPIRVGFGKRLGAYLLDFVAAGIGGSMIGMFAGASLATIFFATEVGESMDEADALSGGIVGLIGGMIGTIAGIMLFVLLIMIMEALTGQTIGKMILGIKNANDDGTEASTITLATRAGVKYISTILTVLAGITGEYYLSSLGSFAGFVVFIGFFFILGDNKQGFHDMLSKTAVFEKSDLGKM